MLLKKAKPYIVKALIFPAFSTGLVDIVLEYGILHILSVLYVAIALGFHIYLLDKRLILFFGLASLYCFAIFADIVADKGYFLTAQLLFSFGTPLVLFEEVGSIVCYIIDMCKFSETIQGYILEAALGFLLICLIEIFRNMESGPSNHTDAQRRDSADISAVPMVYLDSVDTEISLPPSNVEFVGVARVISQAQLNN